MLNNLKLKNPNLKIYSVEDEAFKPYGSVIKFLNTKEIVNAGKETEMPEEGSAYLASFEKFEALGIAEDIKEKCFGETECQIGYCYGHSNFLNALEWHTCNEINIAVTDTVLILAKRSDLDQNGEIHSKDCKVFFVPEGAAIEVYSDTLHFCPCEVSKNGFGMVVALTKGTNTPLNNKQKGSALWAKNKWLIAHCQNSSLIQRGAAVGIYGENIEIKY